jgi:arylsulfatase A-like enzyme
VAEAASTPPNIVIIFIDDMGYADIGPFGNKLLHTPHLDRFAQEGMRFTHFYATPVCSMSRACLLTGCYNARVGIPGVIFPQNKIGLNPQELTFAKVAKSCGYETMMIGKWHLGHYPEFLPTRQGFDHYFGLPYSNDMKASHAGYPPLPLYRDEKVLETEPDQSQLTRRYTEEAVKFLKTHTQQPFLLYLPHTMIHAPVNASENFKGKSAQGLLGDAIEEIDWSVGQVMQTLRELGLDEKTLVIFTSDNGPDRRAAPPFRGNKTTNFEGGVREPCIMRWPGHIPAGTTCERFAGNIDVLPTIAHLIGATLPQDHILDGRDFSPLLSDPQATFARDTHLYFNAAQQLDAIRQGEWKLFLKNPNKKATDRSTPDTSQGPVLYNLVTDVAETQNVADAHSDIVARLTTEANTRLAEIKNHLRPPAFHEGSEAISPLGQPAVKLSDLKVGAKLKAAQAPQVGGKAFTISCTLETKQTDGIILSHGGTFLGYALHLRGGKVVFSVRTSKGQDTDLVAPTPLPSTPTNVAASLALDGKMTLEIGDGEVVTAQAPGPIPRQPAEDFCLGFDADNPAAKYSKPDTFEGSLRELIINVR